MLVTENRPQGKVVDSVQTQRLLGFSSCDFERLSMPKTLAPDNLGQAAEPKVALGLTNSRISRLGMTASLLALSGVSAYGAVEGGVGQTIDALNSIAFGASVIMGFGFYTAAAGLFGHNRRTAMVPTGVIASVLMISTSPFSLAQQVAVVSGSVAGHLAGIAYSKFRKLDN